MTEFTDYLENRILDHVFRNTASIGVATVGMTLHTTTSSDATPGTEVTNANGYSRQAIAFNAASGGSIGNTSIEAFTASGGNFSGTVVSTGFYDSTTHGAGNQLAYDNDFTDTTVNDGDTLQFAATTGVTISIT